EARRTDAGLERADPKVWTLQGHIFVEDESWLKGKTVALFDAAGALQEGSETELAGDRFVIRLVPRAVDPNSRVPQDVFVAVSAVEDRRRRVLFVDPRPLRPQVGRVTYVEINVGTPRPAAGTTTTTTTSTTPAAPPAPSTAPP